MQILVRIQSVVIATASLLSLQSPAQAESVTASAPERAISAAADENKPIFVMFYKEQNRDKEAMVATLKAHWAVKKQQAAWTAVRITDPAQRRVAEKFKVTRAPMPSLVAIHPNGAVTGVFPKQVTQSDLSTCIVSPKTAECLKSLQGNRMVFICVQTAPEQSLPPGVEDFQADPHFARRTSVITVAVDDPKEARFLAGMDLDPATIDKPVTVFLAPPGAHVGTFDPAATKEQLAEGLAAAGKCCDDKNCKHNKKSK